MFSKVARCRFYVVLGDSPAFLGMPDIELLGIMKIMCDVIEGQQADRMFDSQIIEPFSALSCKANTDIEGRSDNTDGVNNFSNMPDYFRSNSMRGRQKGQLINYTKIHNDFDFFRKWVLQGHI